MPCTNALHINMIIYGSGKLTTTLNAEAGNTMNTGKTQTYVIPSENDPLCSCITIHILMENRRGKGDQPAGQNHRPSMDMQYPGERS